MAKKSKRATASPDAGSAKKKGPRKSPSLIAEHVQNKRAFGSIVVKRFGNVKVPASVKPALDRFKNVHANLKKLTDSVQSAHVRQSGAQKQVDQACRGVDKQLDALANAFVGAELGTRIRPFSEISNTAPSRYKKLAAARKVREVRALLKKADALGKKGVAKAIAACRNSVENAAKTLGNLSAPQQAFQHARRSLDAVVGNWTKSYDILKKKSAGAWAEDDATFKALFAPPSSLQQPRRRARGAKKSAAPRLPAPQPMPAQLVKVDDLYASFPTVASKPIS